MKTKTRDEWISVRYDDDAMVWKHTGNYVQQIEMETQLQFAITRDQTTVENFKCHFLCSATASRYRRP